ncbi:HERV-H LTR-associating protein 1 [Crotalus tigris]|uniref:HERV-H LTR-associating protein 1 n=1 Tax=Crotalus tigris TaxID=88082 RepID=UPI00192FB3D9|nr:HERV-H LTR-associating protein 1 [Crotalus tigris]
MPWFSLRSGVNLSIIFLYFCFISNLAASTKTENKKEERVVVMATAELPAKLVDLAAMNLTGMVNGMLNTALRGTKEFFSLLSIVSYSSYAFHKVSIVLYNISSLRNIDSTKFSTRYCYCLSNRTNDLTDFTALLVDIVGNSTSYLTEIFKSTSIVSVSQSNDTDCIYICVMSGRIGRNLTDLWEAIEKSPIVNYTFSGNISDFLAPKLPSWTQTDTLKEDLLLTKQSNWLKPGKAEGSEVPVVQASWWPKTNASKESGAPSAETTLTRSSPASIENYSTSSRFLPAHTARIPLQAKTIVVKEDEAVPQQFTIWQNSATSKSSPGPSALISSWLQTNTSTGWDLSPTQPSISSAPLIQSDFLSKTRPGPTMGVPSPLVSPSTEEKPVALKTRPPFMTGNTVLPALVTQRPNSDSLSKVNSKCTQVIKKGSLGTVPPLTVQKLNPCVMELCRFYQRCFCTRDRSYSRDHAMRYCVENYPWFFKNAAFICEKVKRSTYSKTLKQKCLKYICKAI